MPPPAAPDRPRRTACRRSPASLVAKAEGRTGFRTLVAGETAGINAGSAAIELARQLARQKRR